MRSLGIDFGERRIGLAISDADGRVATPLATLARSSDEGAIRAILAVVREEGVARLVVGEPLSGAGERGTAAARARRFADKLAAASGLPCRLVDETLTSVEAERRLREAGVPARRRRQRLDAAAAQILLQELLDRERSGG